MILAELGIPIEVEIGSDWIAARLQMAFTLGFHIVLACFGVGLPVVMMVAEYLGLRGNGVAKELARRWSKAFAVLFAVGAVSGTVLSFELGILWPKFMGTFGGVIGLPFTLEGYAFFLEAIFAGIYLYGWDRLPPKVHWLTGIPIALSGFASAWFVVTANAWMNAPCGFEWIDGEVSSINPLAAMWNPATGAQTTHMILAAYMVTGFGVAAYYAWRILKGHDSAYHRLAMRLGLGLAILATPLQIASGDWAAKVVAKTQPAKLAAMEAHFHTATNAPLWIGGIPDEANETVRYGIRVPGALSFLAKSDWDAEILGLEAFPDSDRPPVAIVHFAFQVMVGIGVALLGLSVWAGGSALLRRRLPDGKTFRWAVVCAGPLAAIALEAGWIVTEVGRQPWIVYQIMRTSEAVTRHGGVWIVFFVTLAIYAVLFVGLLIALSFLARQPLSSQVAVEGES